MFDLKRPCVNCPFRKGQGSKFRLRPDRLAEIRTGSAFQCHKTVDYSDDEPAAGNRPQQCAGLMGVLTKEGSPNQIMQVAERLGSLDPTQIVLDDCYEDWDAVLKAHAGQEP